MIATLTARAARRIDGKRARRSIIAVVAMPVVSGLSMANAQTIADSGSLVDLSLEQLSNIVVTSVSRRAESLANAAASVYVITHDEIRRSDKQRAQAAGFNLHLIKPAELDGVVSIIDSFAA